MWQKYEALVSSLSHSLCEELRLVLQPTQATQLRFNSAQTAAMKCIYTFEPLIVCFTLFSIASSYDDDNVLCI